MEVGFRLSKNFYKGGSFYIQLLGNLYRLGKHGDLFNDFAFWDYNTCTGSNSKDLKGSWGGTFE